MIEALQPPPTVLLEVRAGKVKDIGNSGQKSAIFKQPQLGKVKVTSLGVAGDEHAYKMHGGVDKALHQYSADHYPIWQKEKPDRAHLFDYGGFGENLVTEGLNEDNVCIGDKFRIGENVIVEISEPRMPCATLNRRFEWRRASVRTQRSGRAGWYLRVLQAGFIEQGDQMVLLERTCPAWSITNCQRVLFAESAEHEMLQQMSQLTALGTEIKQVVLKKLKGEAGEDAGSRLQGATSLFYNYKMVEAKTITRRVKQFTFAIQELENNSIDPEFGRFPFMRLKFGPSECFERSYSVVSGNKNRFTLGIANQSNSRGGSSFLHQTLSKGDIIRAAEGSGEFDVKRGGLKSGLSLNRHIFIIGGIGVTAFLLEIGDLEAKKAEYEIHYAVRSMEEAAYSRGLPSSRTTYYAKDQNLRLDLRSIIPEFKPSSDSNTMIYCCGPESLMTACQDLVEELGYPDQLIHMESFGVDMEASAEPFEVEVDGTGRTLQVPSNKSLLQVLNECGFDVPSSCRAGNCGMCTIDYRHGNIEHRGSALTKQEKLTSMLSCVSRAKGKLNICNDF